MPRQNQDDLTYLMGGEMDRGFFHLKVHGEDLDPAAVSALLNRNPTSSHRKGDIWSNGKGIYSFGSWSLDSGELSFRSGEKNCEDQLSDWVASLPGEAEVWTEIQKSHEAYVLLAFYMSTWNREFDIHPKTMLELGKRGLRIHIDTYYSEAKAAPETLPS